ncbi:MAG: hypothetical protein AABX07_00445 [Nanoarchaeota archaeon]
MDKKANYVDELSEYLKKNLRKGYTKESLKWALVSQGHSKMEVDKAIKKADEELAREAPILKTKPEITYEVVEPKDAIVEKKKSWWKKIFGL